jgi:hypothetical protein
MKELWIGVVEVFTGLSADDGNCAFTNVVTWADGVSDYMDRVTAVFEEYRWTVLASKNVQPVDPNASYSAEIAEVIDRAKSNPDACIFAAFHYYRLRLN